MASEAPTPHPSATPDIPSAIAWGEGRVGNQTVSPPSPMQIGQCQIQRVIASGGMGTVYEATQLSPRRTVAVKVMKLGVSSRTALDRFRREVEVLGSLRHPGIAQIHEAGTFPSGLGEAPYFVMEHIPEALSITQYCREHELAPAERLELFMQVCDAVHHGHTRGVVHRDLKPSNILVDAQGRVKVIDFGVARATDSDLAATTLQTEVGQLIGTLQYMSPEQADGRSMDIDARSDIYSLGVMLFELLTGELPYPVKDTTIFDAVRVIRESAPSRLSSKHRQLRGDLETIVGKALEKDPHRRYQSASELRDDLQRFMTGEPIIARRPTLGYLAGLRARAFVTRHPAACWLLCVLAACALGEFIVIPLVYDWTLTHDRVVGVLNRTFPPPASDVPLTHVRVLKIDEASFAAAADIAASIGSDAPTLEARRPLRALHGRLLERLADTNVKAVGFDLTFLGESPYDQALADGVAALKGRGVATVISVKAWPLDDQGSLNIASAVQPAVAWGGITTQANEVAWLVDLAAQRSWMAPAASLPLACFGAFEAPGMEMDVHMDVDAAALHLRYFTRHPGDPRVREFRALATTLPVTTISPFAPSDEDDPELGLSAGDLLASFQIDLRSDAALEQSSMRWEDALLGDIESLRRAVDGKLLMIGYAIEGEDQKATPDGRELHGVYAHAIAADMLLDRQAPARAEHFRAVRVLVIGAAATGALIALLGARRATLMAAFLSVAGGGLLLTSVAAFQGWHFIMNPAAPLLTLAIGFGLMAAMASIRNRRVAGPA